MGTVITNFPSIAMVSASIDYAALSPYGYLVKKYRAHPSDGVYHVISNYGGYGIKGFTLSNPGDFRPYGGSDADHIAIGICLLCNTPFTFGLVLKEESSNSADYYYYYPEMSSGIIRYNSSEYNGVVISSGSTNDAVYGEYTGIYAVDKFSTFGEGLIATGVRPIGSPVIYPITYRPTNCSFPNAPTEAVVGSTVNVPVSFPDGYGLVNPSDAYVMCNGVVVHSSYSNGTLTFTMPDPS